MKRGRALSGSGGAFRARRGLLLVLLLALVVRLGWLVVLYQHERLPGGERLFRAAIPSTWEQFVEDLRQDRLFSDQPGFEAIARNLLAGKGYRIAADGPPTAFRPPVYPLFLASLYAFGGNQHLTVRLVQVLVELGTILLLVAISRRVFGSQRAALLAGAVYAVYFPIALYAATLFSETLYTFLLALFMWALVRARGVEETPARGWRRGRVAAFAGAGMLLGVVTLTKPTTLLLPVFLALPLVWRRDRVGFLRREVVRELLPLAAGMCLVLAPWMVRNYVVLGEIVPVTTGGGRAFWGTNYIPDADPLRVELRHGVVGDTPETDRRLYRQAVRNVLRHPLAFARLSGLRFVRLWFNLGFVNAPSRASLAIGAFNLLLVALSVAAVWRAPGPWLARASPLALLLLYFSLVHMVLEGYIRYALPVLPYLMMTAAYGAVALARRRDLAGGRPVAVRAGGC